MANPAIISFATLEPASKDNKNKAVHRDYFFAAEPELYLVAPKEVVLKKSIYITNDPTGDGHYKIVLKNKETMTRQELAKHISKWLQAINIYHNIKSQNEENLDITWNWIDEPHRNLCIHDIADTGSTRHGLAVYCIHLSS